MSPENFMTTLTDTKCIKRERFLFVLTFAAAAIIKTFWSVGGQNVSQPMYFKKIKVSYLNKNLCFY